MLSPTALYLSILHDENPVRVHDGIQSVSDCENRTILKLQSNGLLASEMGAACNGHRNKTRIAPGEGVD